MDICLGICMEKNSGNIAIKGLEMLLGPHASKSPNRECKRELCELYLMATPV